MDINGFNVGRHLMLIGMEEHFRKTRKVEESEFLRPYKQLFPDVVVSDCLVRALDLASEIYTTLDNKGHRVLFASLWRRKVPVPVGNWPAFPGLHI
ncbi:hypothetical protein ACCS62_28445 [Rhizobium ruizarguesonis]